MIGIALFMLWWFGLSLIATGLWSIWRITAEQRARRRAVEELIRWANRQEGAVPR